MVLPVETDYWGMINSARRVMVKQQTLHAKVGFMNWGQITTMKRPALAQYIQARGMRQIVIMGPMSGAPWLGMYSQYLYEPTLKLKGQYTNESWCLDKRAEACAILHSLEKVIGAELECLAPFELAMTPDLAPGSVVPHFPGSVATLQDGSPAPSNNWGPCVSAHDGSAACQQFIAMHGRSFVYIMDTKVVGPHSYLNFVKQKFDEVLARGFSGAYFDLFSYAYGTGFGSTNPGRFRYTWDRSDGFSVDLAPNHTIARQKADLCLWTAEARAQLVKSIIASSTPLRSGKAPSIVVNDMAVADIIRELPIHHFVEGILPQGYAQTHLSTPIVLGWTPSYTPGAHADDKSGTWWNHWVNATNADLLSDMRDKLASGCLYFTYWSESKLLTNCSLYEHMYPITVRELHAGYVIGEERILVTRPGRYGWNDSTPLSALRLHCFTEQAEGVEVAPTIHTD